MAKPLIVVTMGDPTGVGPEVIARALARPGITETCRILVLGDEAALRRGIEVTGVPLRLESLQEGAPPEVPTSGSIYLRPLSKLGAADLVYGKPTAESGEAMFSYITEAARMCLSGEAAAMATAPINKEAMNRAGHRYPGHTELLAELTGTREFVMMLAGDRLRVTLVTIHEALRDVPRLVTTEKVFSTIRITHRDVDRYFRRSPRLAVLALNPHCGEGGMFGDEEERIIRPAVQAARAEGVTVSGPWPSDTLFVRARNGAFDGIVAMYHDQGHIALKLLGGLRAVNISAGLPLVRTSVAHGTAYDIAGRGTADPTSLIEAVKVAAKLAATR